MTLPMQSLARRLRPAAFDARGTSAVEFAIVLPVLLTIVFGSYQVTQAVAAYRKLAITARTVADLTTQYASMQAADVSTVLNASAQIMVPFNTSSLSIVLTEYQTTAAGVSIVIWSKALNGTPATVGSVAIIPANVAVPNSYIIFAKTTYSFTPAVAYKLTGPFVMTSQIYMTPRQTASVSYSGT